MRGFGTLAFFLVLGLAALPAAADTMDFTSGTYTSATATYVEGAMEVVSENSSSLKHLHFFDGGLQNHANDQVGGASDPYRFSLTGGGTFDAVSVDVTQYITTESAVSTLTTDKGGSVTLNAATNGTTINLAALGAAWQGVNWILWDYDALTTPEDWSSNRTTIDNLVFNEAQPVPEPATMALLGVGGLGLLAEARRRRRRQAKA